MNDKTLIIGLMISGLLTTALLTHHADVALLMLPFLGYLGLGIFQSPVSEKIHLEAQRTVSKTNQDETIFVEVCVVVENKGSESVTLHLQEALPETMEMTGGALNQWARLEPNKTTELSYSCRVIRGYFVWQTIQTVVCDPLGLIESRLQLPAEAEIQILPRTKKIKPFQMRPHSTLHSPGSIPAGLGGSGINFWGVREYHPGDSMRWMYWRLTARHPQKYFTKEFEQEEIAEIGLILDARYKTELRRGEESLFEYGIQATASLAEMFLHQGHRVSLFVFGEKPKMVFPGYGKVQHQRIMKCLSRVKIGAESGAMGYLDSLPIRVFPSRALLILVSPLSSDDWMVFLRLRAAGYQVLLIVPDPIEFSYQTLPFDETTHLAVRAARIERQIKINKIKRLDIPVINWNVNQSLFPLLRHVLTRSNFSRRRG